MAFCTLPRLRQRVQTYARVALPLRSTRTRWRFGLKRRFVATIEWLRLLPKPGFFPQIAQIFDIEISVAEGGLLAGGRGVVAQLREQIRHLERRSHGLGAL